LDYLVLYIVEWIRFKPSFITYSRAQ